LHINFCLIEVRVKKADPTEKFYKISGNLYSLLSIFEGTDEEDNDDIELFDC
jgi:hypothetical protein